MSLHEEEATQSLQQSEFDPSLETAIERGLEMPSTSIVSQNSDVCQERPDGRQRTLTEKGREFLHQETQKREKAFIKAYDSWKQTAKQSRATLKSLCSPEDLGHIEREIEIRHRTVCQQYEPIKRNHATTPMIANKMDACNNLTEEITTLVNMRMQPRERYNEELEKQRVRMVLNKEEYGSVFGRTETETVISDQSESQPSFNSSHSSQRLEAEAELAAKREQAKAIEDIQAQQAKIIQLESELKVAEAAIKVEEAARLAEVERKRAERHKKLEQERTKLARIQAEKEVQVAAARVKAYDSFGSDYEREFELNTAHQEMNHTLNPNATSFQPQQAPSQKATPVEAISLAQAIASSLSINRLPVPEPTKFTGDPIRYVDCKTTFMALIDQKPIPIAEKMFYLKTYLSGEALKAVEGFFYRTSEDGYQGAWKVLEERYGNPFIVQKAFRDKLSKWPKISATDPISLRDFTDFLQGCAAALPHVKGLSILNDCEENQKLLQKLPEWIVRKWSRVVVEELDKSNSYPDLAHFIDFLNKEVRIVCNPITAPFFMNAKANETRTPQRTRALSTTAQIKEPIKQTQETFKPKPPCAACKNESHGIVWCPTFASKSLEEKRAFIQENNLCFGCLRKGHTSKNCQRRHICSVCHGRHPTCLHEERKQRTTREITNDTPPADKALGQEAHVVHSHTSVQYVPATSSIVPVLVSSSLEPQREVLTYAILDQQSDATFILEDLLDNLNVESAQPATLKLSTMTAIDTVLPSKCVSGLQVRALLSGKPIQINQAFSRSFIPVDKSYIPTKETAQQWCHLQHLTNQIPTLQDCEVGLLIGSNCPAALAPIESVIGGGDKPFAQRTELGWSIVGPSNLHHEKQGRTSYVHRIAVKEIPTSPVMDELKALELDFSERNCEKYMSQDVNLGQFLSKKIRQKDRHLEMLLPFKNYSPSSLSNNKKLATIPLQCRKRKLKSDPLPNDFRSRWEKWKLCLEKLQEVVIPQCYHPQNFSAIIRTGLHHFADASCKGCGDSEVKVALACNTKSNDSVNLLNRLSRISLLMKLLKVVTRIKRLESKEPHRELVTVTDTERAAKIILKLLQQQAFPKELKMIQRGEYLLSSRALSRLDPILRRNLLCDGGRLKKSTLSLERKCPIILPKDSNVIKLILAHYHIKTCHQRRGQTQMAQWALGYCWGRLVAKLIQLSAQGRKRRDRLMKLTTRQESFKPRGNLQMDDENLTRNQWLLGRVVEAIQ
ncbi:uncharacterized protein LOC130917030 [Corythoichthys intestinalis]|uniref:uncharacterized protein LOC130917030 n=1 Tax=Corythoichthys intestinalis TaxID=161448 RepID=UPI0025A613EB|nr:uncharacterized protein LOC130917030 [Corythoichthys intestinalis]XP_057694062.1 uncharacterized protein LOC130917030 [Corythoichthys intestinalis]